MILLVTGTTGFIGTAVYRRLLDKGDVFIGLDNTNDYYNPKLKYGELGRIGIKRMTTTQGNSSSI